MWNIIYCLKSFFNTIVNKELNKFTLGRWRLENNKKTYIKTDFANHDHCGTCQFRNKYTLIPTTAPAPR